LMVIATSSRRAAVLCNEFLTKAIKKEYIARCSGAFPEGEVVVEQPMLTVDKQMGLNIVHAEGKYAKTIFNRLFYDEKTDSSVLHCQPVTGRSHQIRVHLQYLGYPIANDPVYCDKKVWGSKLGRGGLDFTALNPNTPPLETQGGPAEIPAEHSTSLNIASAKAPDIQIPTGFSGEALNLIATMHNGKAPGYKSQPGPLLVATEETKVARLPRETGEDIGMASPVPLTAEAVAIIAKLRNMKDENEDWSRWRDVIFQARKALIPQTVDEVTAIRPFTPAFQDLPDGSRILYCPDCYLPLHADPHPSNLYIFLHARRYSTAEWSFETEVPDWAQKGWEW